MITNDELLKWINNMPIWFREAVALYYQNNKITEQDITKLTDHCIQEVSDYIVENINLIAHRENSAYSVKSISNIVGVNAICTEKPLVFNPNGITVVYGLNGAGKSGYIRVLKNVSGAKYREKIKNNIYSKEKVNPKAKITIISDTNVEQVFDCDLGYPGQYEILRSIDIFDSKIASAYVNEAKEATYEPWVFSLLSEMASVATKIKSELKDRKEKYILSEYNFPDNLKETEAYRKLESITAKSNIADFPDKWTAEKEKYLLQIKKKSQVEIIEAQIKNKETELKNIKVLKEYFDLFREYFSDSSWEIIKKNKENWEKAYSVKNAAELLLKENSTDIDAQSIGIEAWKKMWEYAHQYFEQMPLRKNEPYFTDVNGKCPLCRQEIKTSAVSSRMQSIDEYANGKTADVEKNTFRIYEKSLKAFPPPKPQNEFGLYIESAGLDDILEDINKYNDELGCFHESINGDIRELELRRVDLKVVLDTLTERYIQEEKEIQELKQLNDSKEQQALLKEIKDNEATKYLVSINALIVGNIEKLKKIAEIDTAEKKVTTNKITAKSKELAEQMLTAEYVSRFDDELDELTHKSVKVQLKQQRAGSGKIPYKVVLCDADGKQLAPQDILSEGENRVTSLAAFFAESSGRVEATPLIVDDPISSLDYAFEAKVVDRLVKASQSRQVIVFTHRISMVVGISEMASKANVKYAEVSLMSNNIKKGVPSMISNIGGKTKSQLNCLINDNLSKLKKMDEFSTEYKSLFHNTCQEFRNIVEKSVEDYLLGGVVKRFRRDVQTKNRLQKITEVTKEDCSLIDGLMTKYSYYDHSMSDETPLQELELSELEANMIEMQEWMKTKKD